MIRAIIIMMWSMISVQGFTQTIGGSSVFNFLRLPNTPQLTALGGVNVSNFSPDAGMSFNNPALLRQEMHGQLNAVFNNMYGGIKNYHLSGAYYSSQLQTSFGAGIQYLNYGAVQQTDASGNVSGSFSPGDYSMQVAASRKYLEHWYYGAAVKFIYSNYGLYRANGVAMDMGVAYYDSTHAFQVSLLLKNMGFQLKTYMDTRPDDLPFDVQLGITKRLEKAPIQFSLTAHHLHEFNLFYNDSLYNNENGFGDNRQGQTINKILRHLVFAGQIFPADKLEITAAYNYLRRKELSIDHTSNGLTGFSLGVGLLFRKLQIRYARGYYQNNTGYNQFGVNIQFK